MKVYTKHPLWKIFHNAQESSRLAEWVSYLSAYRIIFKAHKAEKGHAFASLFVNFLIKDAKQKDDELTVDIQLVKRPIMVKHYRWSSPY